MEKEGKGTRKIPNNQNVNPNEDEATMMPVGDGDNAHGNDWHVDIRDKDSNELMNDLTHRLV